MKEEVILPSDERAARHVTITGWVARDGRFWGEDERMARYCGSTHSVCEDCGATCGKSYLVCDPCRNKRDLARYQALPLVPWNGKMFTTLDGDEWWDDIFEFFEWCEDEGVDPKDMWLVNGEEIDLYQVHGDMWVDQLPEDGELPQAIEDARRELNRVIREHNLKGSGVFHVSKERICLSDGEEASNAP